MHALYYTDVQNIQKNNRLNHNTKLQNQSFGVEQPLRVHPTLTKMKHTAGTCKL